VGNIEFAWDRRKARSNLAKHGVTFEEAQTAFLDEGGRLIDDPVTRRMRSASCCSATVYKRTA
jgi:uncharacterized DUF497 family protein